MSLSTLFAAQPYDAAPLRAALPEFGFPDGGRAERLLQTLAKAPEDRAALTLIFDPLIENLSRAADPPRALLNFSNLCDAAPASLGSRAALFQKLADNPEGFRRLARLLGFSQALSDFVIRAPELLVTVLAGGEPLSRPRVRRLAHIAAQADGEDTKSRLNALRRFRQAQTLRIGLLDLDRDTWRDARDFALVVRQISDLAQVCVEVALEIVTGGNTRGFCVLMMGKGGARELNYSSDIDLIFLAEEREDAAEVGQILLRELGEPSVAGQLWRVDMRLRPDGGSGPLVTPLSYALSYYESFAAAWEWQALIKTRVVGGDARLGRRFRKFTRGITWAKRADDTHLHEVYEMKKRSEATNEGSDPENLKQGPGGIRDAEWVVQQLQMMLGPSHPRARAGDTLRALAVLEYLDALSPDEARRLREGYLWLRVAEHRLQLLNEQAVRVLPNKPEERAALARRLGCAWRDAAAIRFLEEEHARHRKDVRALCEKLFWTFQHDGHEDWEAKLPEAVTGNKDSLLRIQRLAHGTKSSPLPAPLSRQIRTVLPNALEGLERAANTERALVNFENLCEASGNRLSLLRSLDASPSLSNALFTILGGSQQMADMLIRYPELLDLTANRLWLERGRSFDEARAECRAYCLTFRDRKAALRRWRGREMLRIGLRDLLQDQSPHEITREIAMLANACLDLAVSEVRGKLWPDSESIGFAVIAMGKFGGLEMHYASDCDVIFAYSAATGAPNSGAVAAKFAEELIAFLGGRTEDGPGFDLDVRLRPYGASGTIASSLDSFREYFENEKTGIAVWERQALTRARFAAGDGGTGARAMALMRGAAFPTHWWPNWSDELRHIKVRVEKERATKGARSGQTFDVKLGPGGLADIEWTAQWLALKFGHQFPALHAANTRRQLFAAQEAGLLSESELETLDQTYTWLRCAELRLQIAREGAAGGVKKGTKDAAIWARAVFPGIPAEEAEARFEAEWNQHTAGSRTVFERIREII